MNFRPKDPAGKPSCPVQTGYKPRPILSLGLWAHEGWRIKIYGISADSPIPRPDLIDDAKSAAISCLPDVSVAYGVGWMIVHQARGLEAALVDWWFDENIAQHHVFGRPHGASGPLVKGWPKGAGFCVWELAVCWWEREAWLAEVLSNGGPAADNLDRYVASIREGDV